MPAFRAVRKFWMIGPGGEVKSFSAVENTVGTVSSAGAAKGVAVRPWLAQIALTG